MTKHLMDGHLSPPVLVDLGQRRNTGKDLLPAGDIS
jgi:hypothetical protein